jgi:hypothetical protein
MALGRNSISVLFILDALPVCAIGDPGDRRPSSLQSRPTLSLAGAAGSAKTVPFQE